MTRSSCFAAAAVALMIFISGASVHAQCATCVPTVAYSPVVAPATTTVVQPTVVRSGWYPGWLLDRWRMNRWSATAVPVAATVAPTYTASYLPATAYSASYAPYVASYAPLASPVVQTSYYMPATPTVAAYAPTTVYRPVEISAGMPTAIVEPACAVADPCNACGSTVTTASYAQVSPVGCSSCAPATTSGPVYSSAPLSPSTAGPPTGRPELGANEPTPATSQYKPETNGGAAPSGVAPGPAAEEEEQPEATPEATGPEGASGVNDPAAFLDFQAPPLIGPQNDRTANRPTVNVHNAVFSKPARASSVSTTVAKPAVATGGWYSVEER